MYVAWKYGGSKSEILRGGDFAQRVVFGFWCSLVRVTLPKNILFRKHAVTWFEFDGLKVFWPCLTPAPYLEWTLFENFIIWITVKSYKQARVYIFTRHLDRDISILYLKFRVCYSAVYADLGGFWASINLKRVHPSPITHQRSPITHQRSAINHQPSTINHQLSTINYQLSIINHQR